MTYSAENPQFTLYSSPGPNPWKVAFILRELNLSYKLTPISTNDGSHKKSPFIDINPNGRLPALIDHSNNDFTIWESGAIVLYLVQKYDTEHKIFPTSFNDQATAQQWLMFQMSGQGPMWGQYVWFMKMHPEKVESVQQRYYNEIVRTIGVLDIALEGKDYLVGNKLSYADLSFVCWCWLLEWIPELKDLVGKGEKGDETVKHKNFVRWLRNLLDRESVKIVAEERIKETAAPSS